jgi:hypothetical protein
MCLGVHERHANLQQHFLHRVEPSMSCTGEGPFPASQRRKRCTWRLSEFRNAALTIRLFSLQNVANQHPRASAQALG